MSINGKWFNQLGSSMDLRVNGKNITGTYITAVGDASGSYDLVGKIDTDNDKSTAIGFVVLWNNGGPGGSSDSVTAWSGQIQIIDGEETIATTWLLTSETEQDDSWHSTLVGKDVFGRVAPTQESIIKSLKKGAKSSTPKVGK